MVVGQHCFWYVSLSCPFCSYYYKLYYIVNVRTITYISKHSRKNYLSTYNHQHSGYTEAALAGILLCRFGDPDTYYFGLNTSFLFRKIL